MAASLAATLASTAFSSRCLTSSVRQVDAACVAGNLKPLKATVRGDMRAWSGEGGNPPAERILSLEEILSAAEAESSDLVFSPDDAADDQDDAAIDNLADDPFASRSPIPTDPNAPAAQLFPSADDMEKVLSAYGNAPAAVGEIGVEDLKAALEGNAGAVPVLIDVRAPGDYTRG
ncbi:hypothetical protein CLOP_g23199, partial [Closterium sp. NIES-67]